MSTSAHRRTAIAAIIGGAAWTTATTLHALRPIGCVGASCATTPMRETSPLEAGLTVVGLLLLATAAAGLLTAAPRGRRVGVALVGTGVLGLLAAMVLNGIGVGVDASWMPLLVGPSILALVAGVVVAAVRIVRDGMVPRPVAWALAIATLALLGTNEQTAAAWLAAPFGLAWMAVGFALRVPDGASRLTPRRRPTRPAPRSTMPTGS